MFSVWKDSRLDIKLLFPQKDSWLRFFHFHWPLIRTKEEKHVPCHKQAQLTIKLKNATTFWRTFKYTKWNTSSAIKQREDRLSSSFTSDLQISSRVFFKHTHTSLHTFFPFPRQIQTLECYHHSLAITVQTLLSSNQTKWSSLWSTYCSTTDINRMRKVHIIEQEQDRIQSVVFPGLTLLPGPVKSWNTVFNV